MLGSGKNASGQGAVRSMVPETQVVESPTASAADMTSVAAGAGATAVSEADKAGLVRLPPPRVRAVTATPLTHSRYHLHGASLTRAWRR
jgi:hypothetical protein